MDRVSAERVVSRYIRASDDAALDVMVDHLVDEFLDTMTTNLDLSSGAVEQALKQNGVMAEDIMAISSLKSAGVLDVVRVLGGLVAKGLWWLVIRPFVALGKFIGSGKFRSEVRVSFKRALSHDVRSTRHLASMAGRLVRGEEVNPAERKAAMKHLVDLLVRTVVVYLTAAPLVTSLFAGALWMSLAAIAGGLTDILLVLLNGPIRAAASKLLSADIAQFPGSR